MVWSVGYFLSTTHERVSPYHDHQDYLRRPNRRRSWWTGCGSPLWTSPWWLLSKGRKAEDGAVPAQYHLKEMLTEKYLPRTQANVIDSDATVIFTYGPLKGGSLKTATYVHHLEKPWHEVDLLHTTPKQAVIEIMRWRLQRLEH